MGKQGPCYHCGVTMSNATGTPLWRNGPPEKPILCNACGSRWRTKGTLINYTPLHARAEPIDPEYCKFYKVKSISIKTKEPKMHKRKHCNNDALVEYEAPDSVQDFCKVLDEDMSNRSSSGSAISYSESCTQFGNTDASDLTGSAQSNVWDTLVPSRKRTCINRPKPSPVEKLRQDLCSFLQEQQSSNLSGTSEEDLLFESSTPMDSVEIGHGGVLIKYRNSSAREEESEASSLIIDNKRSIVNETYSGLPHLPVQVESKGTSNPTEKVKRVTGKGTQEHIKRDTFSNEKLHILQHSNSPLRFINLKDIVSFEEFTRHLTHEEQQQLMKYLPSTDTAQPPSSLKSVFDSPQFEEALSSFQLLLSEGIFDLSFSRTNTEECQSLKRLVLANPTKSKWVEEQYKLLKDVKYEDTTGENGIVAVSSFIVPGNMAPIKRSCERNFYEPKGTVKSPKRAHKCGSTNSFSSTQLKSTDEGSKQSYETKDLFDSDETSFSPRSLFTFQPDRSSVTLDYFNFADDNSDQDLLLDVPSNGHFPQAELLHCHPWKQKVLPNGSLVEDRAVEKEKTLSTQSLNGQQANACTRVVRYT